MNTNAGAYWLLIADIDMADADVAAGIGDSHTVFAAAIQYMQLSKACAAHYFRHQLPLITTCRHQPHEYWSEQSFTASPHEEHAQYCGRRFGDAARRHFQGRR